jgi:hypothetical protein
LRRAGSARAARVCQRFNLTVGDGGVNATASPATAIEIAA